jgi:hypothetical protein
VLCSEFKDNIFGFHTITAFDYCAFIIANFSASFKQRVVAFGGWEQIAFTNLIFELFLSITSSH